MTRATSEPAVAPEAWYVAEGKRGQRLLDQRDVGQATQVFEAVLARLGDTPSYGRAVMLGRLARCAYLSARPDVAVAHLREAVDLLGRLAPTDGAKQLRATLRSELGDALRAMGRYGHARKAYEAALRISQELQDLRAQGVDLGRLGTLALAEGKPEEAEGWYRKAIEVDRRIGSSLQLGRRLSGLAALLHDQPGRLVEARQVAVEALAIAQTLDPAGADVWKTYGILADITEQEAAAAGDGEHRGALQAQVRDYRQLERYPPRILATLARLGDTPSRGRAVLLAQLGRSFHMAGQPDLALARLREAIAVTEWLAASDGVKDLRGTLYSDLGDLLGTAGREADAREAYRAAQAVADACEERSDRPDGALAFEVTLADDLLTDYAFDPDLLIDGQRERRITRWTGKPDPLADDVRPALMPGARTWAADDETVHFRLPLEEPVVERDPGCTVLRRTRREVAVAGNPGVLWRLIRGMDGACTVAELVSALPADERAAAASLLAAMAATGVIDVSGRPLGRLLHSATKKGVLPAGGLEGDAVLRLATDGDYRAYPGAPRIAVGQSVPDRLRAFHTLTRSRRSRRDYGGPALRRDDFDALLDTACGVTGALPWAGREVMLRAYPSSGGLYAVEIYPVVFRVEGLAAAVYHYRAVENVLELVRPDIDQARVVGAALPMEREMVAGAAALVCLTGCFPRHERKYGEGGYRMMVAEAGHISQNLILAATALGLAARPFGGVFDDLLNHDLGLDGAEEQFLLAVLVGHAATQTGREQ